MIDDTWEDENERSWHATVSDFITEITELEAERDALKGELAREKRSYAALYRDALSANNSLRVELMMARAERDEFKLRCEAICEWINTNNDSGAGEALYAIAEGRKHG